MAFGPEVTLSVPGSNEKLWLGPIKPEEFSQIGPVDREMGKLCMMGLMGQFRWNCAIEDPHSSGLVLAFDADPDQLVWGVGLQSSQADERRLIGVAHVAKVPDMLGGADAEDTEGLYVGEASRTIVKPEGFTRGAAELVDIWTAWAGVRLLGVSQVAHHVLLDVRDRRPHAPVRHSGWLALGARWEPSVGVVHRLGLFDPRLSEQQTLAAAEEVARRYNGQVSQSEVAIAQQRVKELFELADALAAQQANQ